MANRSIEETINKDSSPEFKYDDSEKQLRKKVKLEHQKILDKIKEIKEGIDISEHEVHKFILIFHTLIETINSEQPEEETDEFVTDAILQIVNTIAGLLRNNIDSLNIPAVLKSALNKLKSFFILKTKDSEGDKTGEAEPENTLETNEASREGRKEQWSSKYKK